MTGVWPWTLVGTSLRRLREQPLLILPFALVGLLSTLVDALRFADPVPVRVQSWPRSGLVSVDVLVFPGGSRAAGVAPGALLGLPTDSLARLVALSAAPLAAGALATGVTVTVARYGVPRSLRDVPWLGLGRLLAYAAGLYAVATLLAVLAALHPLAGVAATTLLFVLAARLFVAPPLVVLGGEDPLAAAFESNRRTRSNDASLLGFVVLAGFASHALVGVPHVGTMLSVTVVGSVSAVATVVADERC
ncbi:hypothetical protein [Halomicrococcus gelatinilyticus]|uniref:hypothetical protein n=1 Tax=Halomicrococcus gelatinilyticus TaxID=1702103 RepID=UPI002E0EAF86